MKPTILFDLDGTLANIQHRRAHLFKEKPDWKSFNENIDKDTPNEPVVDLYQTLWNSEKYNLIIISGRKDTFRNITENWLKKNEIPFSRLLLRSENDNRADHIVKEELLNTLISEGLKISFVIDDRKQVVDMWRRNGIVCLQCDDGDF